ncbi:hypothetical protein ED733_008934 [Metarhizium rileyi]|uniref:Uncharacterized protein n=1 Tax=Metarhizium rileyi (strain RCEF 4871) TaxID=1649241 RepID=A0A5C6GQ85_METRR|nr:hypothetical protein ED733_008934 [Metarhizium rileyi]
MARRGRKFHTFTAWGRPTTGPAIHGSFRKPMRHADELDTPSDPSEPRGREPQDDAKQQRKCIAAAQP